MLGFAELITNGTARHVTATSYVQMMSHTAAVNIGLFFGLTGRIITTSSACTSGSQGIGYAYEAIRLVQRWLLTAIEKPGDLEARGGMLWAAAWAGETSLQRRPTTTTSSAS